MFESINIVKSLPRHRVMFIGEWDIAFIKLDQFDPWIEDELGICTLLSTFTEFHGMWEGIFRTWHRIS